MVAEAPVKVTVPKSAKGTSALPDEKSSTIHSALSSWRALLCEVNVWVTVVPLDTFWTVAVPAVVEVAVTVTMGDVSQKFTILPLFHYSPLIVSPAEMEMPEKS